MQQVTMDEINILFEDNHLLVVVKPQNIPVMPDESKDLDLLTLLKGYLKEKYNKPGEAFLGLVHRLDRPTGGVMMFAKTSKAAERICEAIREGDVEKNYLAVIGGSLNDKQGTLVNYLKKNSATNNVYVATSGTDGAKRAELGFVVLEKLANISLVKVALATGRSHQIRVQMSAQGCPIFGDVKYGDKLSKGSNLALWATELKFNHPVSKERLVFVAYPPEEKEPWKKFKLKGFLENFLTN